ncbi:SprB repeat-containing protein [Aestuariibaculum sp. YM273]|uniref:SprB repeat-containing protein n=1 Tax=Aestuariibaculum sp. YM273 TaxID=3070659 RepID=UPI0027DBE7A4|nr:SprB repeat-containing protein [Aestuariibaculum sp. YM273]WMI65041.1 SprB repeat-containing protein [Aestuariibaculum sp. YM273]
MRLCYQKPSVPVQQVRMLRNDEDGTSDDGSIDATLTNGVSPFTYSWTGPDGYTASTEDISGLAAGTYNLEVTDDNGCKAYASYEVMLPEAFSASATGTDVTCNDEDGTSDDGSIDATLTNGVSPFTYSWTGPDGYTASTEDISGLAAGTYNLEVTDDNGCKAYASYEVMLPEAFSASATGTDVTCNDEDGTSDDGSIDATLTNGVSPFTYSWTGPDGYTASTEDISGLAAGTYNLEVTDDNGCKAYASYEVMLPEAFSASATGTDVTCNDEDGTSDDGSIDATLTNGVSPFTYSWTGPDGYTASTEDISGLAAGTYNLEVTDDNGCKAYASYEVMLPEAFSASATGTDVTCNDEDGTSDDGSIDATLTNGVSPFTYSWTGPDGYTASTEDISGLAAGTYNLEVTDDNGCKAYASYEVMLPEAFSASATGTDVTCNDEDGTSDDGSIDATLTNGVSPFTYSWTGPDGYTASTEDISGLAAGTYNLEVTDDNGCKAYASYEVMLPEAFSASATGTDVTCNDEDGTSDDGSIDATLTNGVSPFTYSWTGPDGYTASTEDISGLAAGTYNLEVTDDNGCKAYASYEVMLPEAFSASATGTDVTCNDEDGTSDDGSIDATLTNGVSPFTYSWTGPDGYTASTEDISGLAAGTYNLEVTDDNGCKAYASYEVMLPEAFSASATGTDVTCNDEDGTSDDGSIDATLTNGVSPFTYSWTGPDGYTASTEDISGLAAGTYNLEVTDDNGCKAYASYEVMLPEAFSASATGTDVTCNDEDGTSDDGSIDATLTNGVSPFTYSWTGPDGYTASTEDISGLAAGTYNLEVTDDNGCKAYASYEVMLPEAFSASATGTDVTCNDEDGTSDDGSIDATLTNGVSPFTYSWTGPDGYTASTEDISGLAAGTYNLEVTDDNGCKAYASYEVMLPEAFSASATGTDVTCNDEDGTSDDGSIDATLTNGVSPFTYSWTGPDGYTASTEDISGLAAGTYNLEVTDDNGCKAYASYEVMLPEAFSASATGTDVTCNMRMVPVMMVV